MKSITVGELRQNPTAMLDDVAAGESYRITRHGRDVGRILPPDEAPPLIPARARGTMRLTGLPAHKLRTAPTIDALLEEMKGAW